ncbi:flagellar biosynthesis protein FlgL [Sulfurimonas sp. SAG-AH-194-C20]|nr:flagellar biosynthesis protein FlgL [Sulfurimonas sp. SAG-AH-194-C20]MDF1879272.1 flagellar biosynthesis protein FlgL [Sulfurimonas sp. SAG-AH-194-C20]
MRVTQSMYYNNIFSTSNSRINQQLFDVNKQIASGIKIQYASDNVRTFTETMRLDNELATIGQVKKSAESGYKVSNQTDVTLNEFTDGMNRMRTLLIQAANDTNSDTGREAIVAELKGIDKNLRSLANTSINGQFLFSGSSVNIKPIADDGSYQGNGVSLNAFLGSNNQQKYNITGAELFLGEETQVKRTITSNVVNGNLLKQNPTLQATPQDSESLSSSSTLRNLMGDTDSLVDPANKHFFYLRGTQNDGTAFKEKIVMKDADTIGDLLTQIGSAYGNTGNIEVVNVSLTNSGQIVVEDKLRGSSKLDFSLVAATDLAGGNTADVTDIDDLDGGETDFVAALAAPGLFLVEFSKSGLSSSSGGGVAGDAAALTEGLVYDRTEFSQIGSLLSSSVPQIVTQGNAFAVGSTKLSEVADLSQGTQDTLDGTRLKFAGVDINGNNYNAVVNLDSAGSTFSLDTNFDGLQDTTYNLYNMDTPRVNTDADNVTYQQLMDIMNMIVTDTLPATSPGTDVEYDQAIANSQFLGNTFLTQDGKISFKDINSPITQATIAIYDANSDDFNVGAQASSMTFNANNSLTIRDPKTDFFKTIGEIINAVQSYNNNPDANATDQRNVGIQNAIAMMDDLQDHTFRVQSVVGAQSNTLNNAIERVGILEISTISLRSSVIDTDLAESSLRLSQLTLNYQAMLSTVGKVSQLSLVNYL